MAANLSALVIPRRFCGPPESANGGYTCASLAAHLDPPVVEVTLRAPPALNRPLEVRVDGERAQLRDGGAVVAEATPSEVEVAAMPVVNAGAAADATSSFAGFADNPFPTCFVCGPERTAGDGMRIFPGRVEGLDVVAAPWTPTADLADAKGEVAAPFVWGALDCPTGWVHVEDRLRAVLGRMAARIDEAVLAGEQYVVVARQTGAEGRRQFGESALQASDGRTVAVARATWVLVE